MISSLIYIGFATIVVFVVYRVGKTLLGVQAPLIPALGLRGEVIWQDHGRQTPVMKNQAYRVLGKGDFLVKLAGEKGLTLVEYKSRPRPVFNSDWVQAITAALAARGEGYPVERVMVITGKTREEFELPKSDRDVFELVRHYVGIVRNAKQGNPVPSDPDYRKCSACAYRSRCQDAQHRAARKTKSGA